jgi:hypothetical protein
MNRIATFTLAGALACGAHAATLQLEGVRLGMTRQEFAAMHPDGAASGVSIAGVPSQRSLGAPAAQFRNGRLEQFSAYFAAADFDRLRNAVTAKNASVQCDAKEQFAVCHDGEGTFVLTRSGDATMLLLQSPRVTAEAERAVRELLRMADMPP